jgi:hypothetical protein
MKPEAQQVAIALACGRIDAHTANLLRACPKLICDYAYSVPNYLSDLNVMHEAEEVLTDEQHGAYVRNLMLIVVGATTFKFAVEEFSFCHATAAQRAEALLRTLNLWTDD